MNNIKLVMLAITSLHFTACATITKDANQPIQIETYSQSNERISGADCVATNDRGKWSTTSTGKVTVHRSGANLTVTCNKDGEAPGVGTVISRANGGMFGNILFGGGIGAIIDHNKGTAYSYPDWIRIILGDNLVYDRKHHKDDEVMLGKKATEEQLKEIEKQKIEEEKALEEKMKKEREKQAQQQ